MKKIFNYLSRQFVNLFKRKTCVLRNGRHWTECNFDCRKNIKIFRFCILILLTAVVFALSACSVDFMPLKSRRIEKKQARTFSVYVCGAVEEEGYIHIFEGTDYQTLVFEAGYITQTVMPKRPQAVVEASVETLIIDYFDGEKQCSCINVNGTAVIERRVIENVSSSVVDKIADYISVNGKITDRTLLRTVLGDDYDDNFYKFYVSESDYEKIN